MSNLKGFGMGWRRKIKNWLQERGEKAYDPCCEETKEHKEYGITNRKKHKWETFPQRLQEDILAKDLHQIEEATKYVVCFFTRYSTGTVSELSHAFYHKIPVYIISTRRLVGWVSTVAHAQGNRLFKTFEELHNFLKRKYQLRRAASEKLL